MNLSGIENDVKLVCAELNEYTEKFRSVLDRVKIVIGNDLGGCKRDNCTADKPCNVCKSLRQLDEDIDGFL
jgi:hypothetical protein